MKLPQNATATDVIDLLAEEVMGLVEQQNADRVITEAQYAQAFSRTFALALPKFLAGLKAARPELAAQLVAQFMDEEEARTAAAAPALPWSERFAGALEEVFPAGDVEQVTEGEGIEALSVVLQKRCRATGKTPCDVLRELDPDDLEYAPRAEAPGAFLANRIKRLA